jgi:hypothetical protein
MGLLLETSKENTKPFKENLWTFLAPLQVRAHHSIWSTSLSFAITITLWLEFQCANVSLITIVPHLSNVTSCSSTIITNGKLLPSLPLCNKLQYFLPIIVCHFWTRMPCSLRIIMWCWVVAMKLITFSLFFYNLFLNTCINWNWRRLQKCSKDVKHWGTIESIWSCQGSNY